MQELLDTIRRKTPGFLTVELQERAAGVFCCLRQKDGSLVWEGSCSSPVQLLDDISAFLWERFGNFGVWEPKAADTALESVRVHNPQPDPEDLDPREVLTVCLKHRKNHG